MKDKFSKFSLPLLWFFATIVIIFMMTFTVNAQGLPVYVDNDSFVGVYGLTADEFIAAVNNSSFAQSNGIVLNFDTPGTFIFNGVENGVNFTEIIIPTSSYIGSFQYANGVTYDTWNSDDNYLTLSSDIIYYYLYERDTLQNALLYYYGYGTLNNNNENFYGVTGNSIGYLVSDYNWNLDPSYKIATNISIPVLEVGVAIVPPTPLDPSYLSGESAPLHVPTSPNITNYTWTTPPTFDNSSVINGIQSIKDTLDWLADNIQGAINNLLNNIKGLFEYIGQTIQYYGNMIILTLNNLIQNFYDNMKSLVENISNNIAYITQPLDINSVSAAFNNTSFFGLKSQFTTFFTTFENAFDISEPNTFTLIINIQNVSTFYNFGCRSPVIIHLDEHFIPIRTALRTFLWILISFGTVFVVERGLSDWLRGENDTK